MQITIEIQVIVEDENLTKDELKTHFKSIMKNVNLSSEDIKIKQAWVSKALIRTKKN